MSLITIPSPFPLPLPLPCPTPLSVSVPFPLPLPLPLAFIQYPIGSLHGTIRDASIPVADNAAHTLTGHGGAGACVLCVCSGSATGASLLPALRLGLVSLVARRSSGAAEELVQIRAHRRRIPTAQLCSKPQAAAAFYRQIRYMLYIYRLV